MASGPVTADHVASIIGVPFLQSIIYIYIFMGQNDTAIQPMTSGPVTSIIGVPFLQSIIYIYIHWLKRHECSSSDAHQRAAVFF